MFIVGVFFVFFCLNEMIEIIFFDYSNYKSQGKRIFPAHGHMPDAINFCNIISYILCQSNGGQYTVHIY